MESLLREGLESVQPTATGTVFEPGVGGAPGATVVTPGIDTALGSVAVVGLGYVGLPTALALHKAGAQVIGIDVSARRLEDIRALRCDLVPADHARLSAALADAENFRLTAEEAAIQAADTVLVCVPTPVDAHRAPDLGPCGAPARQSSTAPASARRSSSPRPVTSAPPATCWSNR